MSGKKIEGIIHVNAKENLLQVLDDPRLLEKMMSDMENANELYRPTNYWQHYQKYFLPELQKKGLKDFRRRRSSVLNRFGAADLLIRGTLKYGGKYYIKGLDRAFRVLCKILERLGVRIFNIPPEDITEYFFRHVKYKFDNNSIDIFRCPTTGYGNPEDLLSINGTKWSLSHLQYCSIFIDTVNYITFKPNMIFCELGSGRYLTDYFLHSKSEYVSYIFERLSNK